MIEETKEMAENKQILDKSLLLSLQDFLDLFQFNEEIQETEDFPGLAHGILYFHA
jgi:hypothetical protein